MQNYLYEFLGTALLVLLGDAVVANVILNKTKGQNSGWVVITLGWACAVLIPALIFTASGAVFNPALVLGLAAIGKLDWAVVPGYILAEMLGGFVGAVLVWVMYKNHFDDTEDGNTKLGVFCTGPAIRSYGNNFISEVIATFVLVFAILGIAQTPVGLDSGSRPHLRRSSGRLAGSGNLLTPLNYHLTMTLQWHKLKFAEN